MYNINKSSELVYAGIESTTNNNNNGLYYIQVEMVDGSSQILQISKEQAIDLGIDLSHETSENDSTEKPFQIFPKCEELVIDINSIKQVQEIVTGDNITEYRVLQPEDMNLKLIKPNKGRLKRPLDEDNITTVKTKKLKTVRTRSGRVTAPPKHIQQIYKRFLETSDETLISANTTAEPAIDQSRSLSPLVIGDFTSLRTNGEKVPSLVPLGTTRSKDNARRRSLLAAQLKCGTCNRAYVGKKNMRKHLKSFPDHRPKTKLNMADSKTWDCLIDTSKMAPAGKRGLIFCRELVNLLQNVKILVRYFFKLQKKLETYDMMDETDFNEKGQYLMNDLLAKVLEIDKGWYSFNENELCKDVSIFSFLENFNSSVLSALSINESSMAGDTKEVSDDEKISSRKDLIEILNNDDNKSVKFENKSELHLSNNTKNYDKADCSKHSIKNKLVIVSNVLIQQEFEVANQYHEILMTNETRENCYKLKYATTTTNCNEDKSTKKFSKKMSNESSIIETQNTTKENNSILKAIDCSAGTKGDEVNLCAENISDILVKNTNSNPNTILVHNSDDDSLNVDQFKYRIGELAMDNLEIPPLEIFQCDSIQ